MKNINKLYLIGLLALSLAEDHKPVADDLEICTRIKNEVSYFSKVIYFCSDSSESIIIPAFFCKYEIPTEKEARFISDFLKMPTKEKEKFFLELYDRYCKKR
jgi:hypothetical protein